jgi:hypothetical protein
MNLFFHHVGLNGAAQDFPKTVFKKLQLSNLVADEAIPDAGLRKKLAKKFPSGEFNCWGVPAGARTIIQNLQEGDYVFLVESSRVDGKVPTLCPVKIFWKDKLEDLSEYLWQDSKYSYIFFFDTVHIDLMWSRFSIDLSYNPKFSPRGNFYKVNSERLDRFGGVSEYIFSIVNTCSDYRGEELPINIINEPSIGYGLFDVQREEEKLDALSKKKPSLTSGTAPKVATRISKREEAFRIRVKQLYDFKCAICSLSLKSLTGVPAVHAAHIYPKSKNGSDDFRNGVCLCHLHHWAFDEGLLAIDDDHKILIHKYISRAKEYESIYKYEGRTINLPNDRRFNPHPLFLAASRKHYGF